MHAILKAHVIQQLRSAAICAHKMWVGHIVLSAYTQLSRYNDVTIIGKGSVVVIFNAEFIPTQDARLYWQEACRFCDGTCSSHAHFLQQQQQQQDYHCSCSSAGLLLSHLPRWERPLLTNSHSDQLVSLFPSPSIHLLATHTLPPTVKYGNSFFLYSHCSVPWSQQCVDS